MSDFTAPDNYFSDSEGFVPPRFGGSLAVMYGTVTFETTTATRLFTLPAGSVVVDVQFNVTTLFNDGSSAVADIGTTLADPDEYVDNLDVTSAGVNRMGDGNDMPAVSDYVPLETDTDVYGLVTLGSTATEGQATVVISYVRVEV